jgi:UMF1 family MFS transporter
LFGLNTGSQQAFTRTIYSTLLPYGREAEYFSFYEVSDKGTAWLGPLVLGIVFDATGSFRQAFVYLEIFFILGLILLWFVDVPKALEEKREFDLNHNSYFLGHADEAVREVQ